jgi:hypothetical protein
MRIAAAALVWLAGCATTGPPLGQTSPAAHTPPPAAGAPPMHPTQIGTTASGGSISMNTADVPAVADSTPSADALAVLGTIPDPLGRPTSESAPVPVPAPTPALGEHPSATSTPDAGAASGGAKTPSSAAGGAAAGGAAAGGAAAGGGAPAGALGGATKSAATDSCWRVQVLAPPEKERADRMAEAAQSQLGVPFVVEKEGGLYKVRTRDCLTSNAAQALKGRAIADGFDGSFRFLKPR